MSSDRFEAGDHIGKAAMNTQISGQLLQPASGNLPAADAANQAVPSGYTQVTTTPASYDASSISAGSLGRNGSMILCLIGVDNTYVGGAGNAIALPNLQLSYDEAAFSALDLGEMERVPGADFDLFS